MLTLSNRVIVGAVKMKQAKLFIKEQREIAKKSGKPLQPVDIDNLINSEDSPLQYLRGTWVGRKVEGSDYYEDLYKSVLLTVV
mgnify:CR=1 FL=1